MKSIKNIREFAESQGESRQVIENRIKKGWKFGVLDGEAVMYPPNSIRKVKGEDVMLNIARR